MSRFAHAPERLPEAPPGGETGGTIARLARVKKGIRGLATNNSRQRFIDAAQGPPSRDLSPTTNPGPKRRGAHRGSTRLAAGLLSTGLAVAACGQRQHEAAPAGNVAPTTASANPNTPAASPATSRRIVLQKGFCDLITSAEVENLFATSDDSGVFGCQEDDSYDGSAGKGAQFSGGDANVSLAIDFEKTQPDPVLGDQSKLGNTQVAGFLAIWHSSEGHGTLTIHVNNGQDNLILEGENTQQDQPDGVLLQEMTGVGTLLLQRMSVG